MIYCKKMLRRDDRVCPHVDQDAHFDIIKRSAEHRGSLFVCIYVCVCHSLTDKEHNGRKLVRWCYLKEVAAFSLYHFLHRCSYFFLDYILSCPFFCFLTFFCRWLLSINANIENKKNKTTTTLFSSLVKILLSSSSPLPDRHLMRIFFLHIV